MGIIFGRTFEAHQRFERTLVQRASLGDTIESSGNLVCRNGGIAWIVAPASTEVSTTWDNIDDAVRSAESNAACRDWFVPTKLELENPGYECKSHWDSYSSHNYWSRTECNDTTAWSVNYQNGSSNYVNKTNTYRVRAFRCVAY